MWKVSINGGEPVQLTDTASLRPTVSPDGQWIGCWQWNEQRDTPPVLAIIPFAGGPPVKTFVSPQTSPVNWLTPLQWAPDGRGLTYIDSRNGVDNIWRQPIDGGKPAPVTDFKAERIESFNWSRDGHLVCSRGVITNDVVLIRDAK